MKLLYVIGEGVRRGEEGGWREERGHGGLNCSRVSSGFLNVRCHSNKLPMPESERKTGGEGKRLLLNYSILPSFHFQGSLFLRLLTEHQIIYI